MESLSEARCRYHHEREAVARCPSCEHFYCRECITEHEDRVVCARCLRLESGRKGRARFGWRRIAAFAQGVCGILLVWGAFYWVARLLIAIPVSIHEGTFWREAWWDE